MVNRVFDVQSYEREHALCVVPEIHVWLIHISLMVAKYVGVGINFVDGEMVICVVNVVYDVGNKQFI